MEGNVVTNMSKNYHCQDRICRAEKPFISYLEADLILAGCSNGSLCIFRIGNGRECLKVMNGIHLCECYNIIRLSEHLFLTSTEQDGATTAQK